MPCEWDIVVGWLINIGLFGKRGGFFLHLKADFVLKQISFHLINGVTQQLSFSSLAKHGNRKPDDFAETVAYGIDTFLFQ